MLRSTRTVSLLLLTSAAVLTSCKKDADTMPGLEGKWKLVDRQCYCIATPLPDETAIFTNTEFTFYREGQRTVYGNYSSTTGSVCGGANQIPVVRFGYVNANSVPRNVVATVKNDTLILDYGGPCDAPVDTYVRVQ